MDEKTDISLAGIGQAETSPAGSLPAEAIVAGRYRIIEKIGQGGMGAVYRAEQIFLHKDCALKTLHAGKVSKVAWRRFQKEAKMAGLLDHPGLVKVQDFGFVDEAQEQPFFAMDFVEGQTLFDLLKNGPLSPEAVLEIFHQICMAIGHAHARGVIHRDIKPSNIIISGSLDDETALVVKIVDFGIAKVFQGEESESTALTRTGEIFGTPFYMSPEQCLGQATDDRSDIYSVGCVMYESLTGLPPFVGETALATMMRHQSEKPITLKETTLGRMFPTGLEEVTAKLLEKNPRNRYNSLFDVAADLERIKEGKLVRLGGSSVSAQTAAFARHKSQQRWYVAAWLAAIATCSTGAFFAGRVSTPAPNIMDVPAAQMESPVGLLSAGEGSILDTAVLPGGSYFSASMPNSKSRYFHFPAHTVGRIVALPRSSVVYEYDAQHTEYRLQQKPYARGDIFMENFGSFGLFTDPAVANDLSVMKRFRSDELNYLDLNHRALSGTDPLKNIVHLKSLSRLSLEEVEKLDDRAVDDLNQLPELSWLEVRNSGISAAGLTRLKRLKQLITLNMSYCAGGTRVLEKLAGSTSIKKLHVGTCGLDAHALPLISTMPNLEYLDIADNGDITDADLQNLLKLHHLHVLEIQDCKKVTAKGVAQLHSLPLTMVCIERNQWGAASASAMQYLSSLFGRDVVQINEHIRPAVNSYVNQLN